jgi:hypothetical protein
MGLYFIEKEEMSEDVASMRQLSKLTCMRQKCNKEYSKLWLFGRSVVPRVFFS